MLVEAAWSAASGPGPPRAFFLRVKDRRGHQVAAVATARKLAVLVWHLLSRGEDYAFARPALVAWKLRGLELVAGVALTPAGHRPPPAAGYRRPTGPARAHPAQGAGWHAHPRGSGPSQWLAAGQRTGGAKE